MWQSDPARVRFTSEPGRLRLFSQYAPAESEDDAGNEDVAPPDGMVRNFEPVELSLTSSIFEPLMRLGELLDEARRATSGRTVPETAGPVPEPPFEHLVELDSWLDEIPDVLTPEKLPELEPQAGAVAAEEPGASGAPARARKGFPVVLALAVLVLVVMSVANVVGFRLLVIRSGSMRPTLGVGELVLSRSTPATDIRVGEIVSFHDPAVEDQLVTHRVVSVSRSGSELTVTTKGDANIATETWKIDDSSSVGRLLFAVPYVGRVVYLISSPYVLVIILVSGIIYGTLMLLRWLWRPRVPVHVNMAPA
jgi:signal peptidase